MSVETFGACCKEIIVLKRIAFICRLLADSLIVFICEFIDDDFRMT